MTFTRKSKYNNVKVTIDGIKFDSKAEATYYGQLKELEKSGIIKDFKRQIRYPLLDKNGTKRLAYIPDFIITTNTGNVYYIDVKGVLTPATNIKIAYFQHVYGVKVHLVYTTGLKKFDTSFIK